MKTFTKRINIGTTNTDTGIEFTMSTPTVDRMGDRVMPDWNLKSFMANPIALFGHQHDKIIGRWESVKVVGEELVGTLVLAKKGTSKLVDEVTSLIEQGILKAVSIGFSSYKVEENDFGGYDLYENTLFECSVVAVPAQAEALRKSLSGLLTDDEIENMCTVNGCTNTKSDSSKSVDAKSKQKTTIKKGINMTIAERIKELAKMVSEKSIELDALNQNADLTDEQIDEMENISKSIADAKDKIKKFENIEKDSNGGIKTTMKKAEQEKRADEKEAKDGVIKSLVVMAKSAINNEPIDMVLKSTYKDNKSVATFIKAATNPALTSTDTWAGNLVQDGYAGYLSDLMANTVFGKVPAQTVTFGKFGSISVPFRAGNGSLSGAFIEEGAPIPVKADAYNTIKITPFKMGVISVFSKEIFRKSIPNIEMLVREHIQTDTADLIDTEFLSATAGDTLRPAGLEASAGVANIVASSGSTVDDILTDFNGVFDRLTDSRLGSGGVILIHPSRLRGLRLKTDALGNFVFKDTSVLSGFEFVTSINVPADKIYVIDEKALIKGIGVGVEFEANSSATIVMGDPAEAISDGTTVAGLPIRSLYQTDSTAIRMVMEISWLQARANGVQILTGVAY